MTTFYYKDAMGRVFGSNSSTPPAGCVRHDGARFVSVPFRMMDAVQQEIAGTQRPFDAAGRTTISDAVFIADALAAAPIDTRAIGFKVQQTLLAAQTATGDTFRNHATALRGFSRSFRTAAARHSGAARDACHRAAESVQGAVDGMEAAHV